MIHVVVMIVGNDNCIDGCDVFNLAWNICIALGAKPAKRATALTENGVEEYTESLREFDEIACMAQPSCTKRSRISRREELGFLDGDRRRSSIRVIGETFQASSYEESAEEQEDNQESYAIIAFMIPGPAKDQYVYLARAFPICGPEKSLQLSQGLVNPLPSFKWCCLSLASSGSAPVIEDVEMVTA